jgi:DNA-binding response OmpR family regulator
MKVLIIEDDRDVAEMIKSGLRSESYTVEVSPDGADGSFLARSYDYDVIVLDYSLPKKNGLEVCREIRASGKKTPIIFLSVNDEVDLKVQALECGADDYMEKPFALKELVARLKAIIRRPVRDTKEIIRIHDVELDSDKSSVTRGTKVIRLTRKEFSMLEYFMSNPGMVLSRALLMEHVWSADSDPFSNTVEAHIRNLRMKINSGNKPNLIVNIPGRGYIFDTPENLKKL